MGMRNGVWEFLDHEGKTEWIKRSGNECKINQRKVPFSELPTCKLVLMRWR